MSEARKKLRPDASSVWPEFQATPYFELLKDKRIIDVEGDVATVSRTFLVDLLAPMLRRIKFDAAFYRQRYQDVTEAEAKGLIVDPQQHYLKFGFFENRMPCLIEVDGSFYAREYPDVAVAILENRVASAQMHFETSGFVEGRLPRKGWSFADLIEN
ncbi:hypothetical protein [Roseococcus thiosulfatophilus]|uniref:hypothetical protein n=1 Tax=Roseococcus thiosulfatophilus TaxID=35813 RepID=UPI001A8E55EF|nr:hypothetical protein [Roseococcus thiosulfatophilus]